MSYDRLESGKPMSDAAPAIRIERFWTSYFTFANWGVSITGEEGKTFGGGNSLLTIEAICDGNKPRRTRDREADGLAARGKLVTDHGRDVLLAPAECGIIIRVTNIPKFKICLSMLSKHIISPFGHFLLPSVT